jgi:hypothetical protein
LYCFTYPIRHHAFARVTEPGIWSTNGFSVSRYVDRTRSHTSGSPVTESSRSGLVTIRGFPGCYVAAFPSPENISGRTLISLITVGISRAALLPNRLLQAAFHFAAERPPTAEHLRNRMRNAEVK